MPDPLARSLDPNRLLFDLQQGNEIAQNCSGCLVPEEIAHRVTEGLVEKFDCAFARLWLLESDQTHLKLVASSGMYTHTNGSFARVQMGAYKVGKIAQNRVSFLSNNLAAEPWVGNRDWAIANNILGFAGYPLLVKDQVIGVLAIFSHHPMEPEFLEVLQTLCTLIAISLDIASRYQKEKQIWQTSSQFLNFTHLSLSDQLVSIFSSTRLTLVGTERPLTLPITYVFLQTAELLNQLKCSYCRLIYTEDSASLEAIVPTGTSHFELQVRMQSMLEELFLLATCLKGSLKTETNLNQRAIQIVLKIPYLGKQLKQKLRIHCKLPLLQLAFTQMAFLAGFWVWDGVDEETPLLTDDVTQIQGSKRILWIQQDAQTLPKGVKAKVDLSITPIQLQQAVHAVLQGEQWGIESTSDYQPALSERELKILTLLTQGYRDRDIADQLIISESTVKFHMNNVLAKLKARTRYQAIHQAIIQGWI